MPKCRGKKEWTKRVNNTGRRYRACQLQAARENRRKASVAADALGTVTGDLPGLQPSTVTVSDIVSYRHSAADITLSECFRIIFQTKKLI